MSSSAIPASGPSSHRHVHVDLGARAYDVVIGKGLLDAPAPWLNQAGIRGPVAIITDSTVAKLYAEKVHHFLEQAGLQPFIETVPAGESSKSMTEVARLLSALAQKKVPRSGTVLGLGGGVVGDLAGYVAASYLRGITFVQAPTTLLAMVDSSVGGKTGVNLPEGKNLVGAFHQPKLVLADLDTLTTLPSNEFAAGMAEIIKAGAIRDKALFDRVATGVKIDDADLGHIIETCVAIKARIVENDEFETKGERALLNFGHTIGHAIEKVTGYKTYLHGEAISLGMRAAAWLSHWETGLPLGQVDALEKALKANHLPTHLHEADGSPSLHLIEPILKALGNDKKVSSDGKNRWVLLSHLGRATSGHLLEPNAVEAAVQVILKPLK